MAKNYIYVIGSAHGVQGVKVGISNNVPRRLQQIQTGHPDRLQVFFTKEIAARDKAALLEERAHTRMARWRLTGEWFDVTPEFAQRVLEEIEKDIGLDPEGRDRELQLLNAKMMAVVAREDELSAKYREAKKALDAIHAEWADAMNEMMLLKEEICMKQLRVA